MEQEILIRQVWRDTYFDIVGVTGSIPVAPTIQKASRSLI